MKNHAQEFPVEKMCTVLKVSMGGYYFWLEAKAGPRHERRVHLLTKIKEMHERSKQRYGSPRICKDLNALGIKISRPRVARVMREAGIRSIVSKKYRVCTTDSNHAFKASENLLNRDFQVAATGEKWVSDLTYIRTDQGWLYLTMIMDLADRKIIGWALSNGMKASETTVAAWNMALKNRPVQKDTLLLHSDRGVQYACDEFRKAIKIYEVKQSMSRKGDCWDNAVSESFFKTLKTELIYHRDYETKADAALEIFEYIEVWYNRKRRHSALDYHTPEEFETKLNQVKNAA